MVSGKFINFECDFISSTDTPRDLPDLPVEVPLPADISTLGAPFWTENFEIILKSFVHCDTSSICAR